MSNKINSVLPQFIHFLVLFEMKCPVLESKMGEVKGLPIFIDLGRGGVEIPNKVWFQKEILSEM